ncbi:MAG TPA: hypothetical protein VIX82_02940 [Solirubrobacteraceae bacterium]
MNNSQLNYLVAKERIDDLARAAERYRLARQYPERDSRRRSPVALVLSRFRRPDALGAAREDRPAAGPAQRPSLDGDGRRSTISSKTSATCRSAENPRQVTMGVREEVTSDDWRTERQTTAADDVKALAHGVVVPR